MNTITPISIQPIFLEQSDNVQSSKNDTCNHIVNDETVCNAENSITKLSKSFTSADDNVVDKLMSPKLNVLDSEFKDAYQNSKLPSNSINDLNLKQKKFTEHVDKYINESRYLSQNEKVLNQAHGNQLSNIIYAEDSNARTISGELPPLTTSTSYAEIWERMANIIHNVKIGYVDFYSNLLKSYTDMYESFNKNVQKSASEAVSGGDDGNNVKFDKNVMQRGYDAFAKDVESLSDELGTVPNWDKLNDDEKANMRLTLEPAFHISDKGEVSFNLGHYDSVKNTYPSGINNGVVSTASYQAWLANFNAASSTLQSNMQAFAQRCSQANNSFDNMNKVLSSAISAMGDSAKQVISSF